MIVNTGKRGVKKDAILTAAARVFGQKGFYEATIEEISIEARVGKGTVYEYFPSKLELFKAMHQHYADAYMSNYERLHELPTYSERLEMVFKSHLRFAVQHTDFARVLFVNPASIGEDLHAYIIENRQDKLLRLRALIEDGIKAGEFKPVDVDVALEMAAAFLGSLIYMAVFSDQWSCTFRTVKSELDMERAAESALDIFLNGIRSN